MLFYSILNFSVLKLKKKKKVEERSNRAVYILQWQNNNSYLSGQKNELLEIFVHLTVA
jgi:hypothetical protein